MGAAELARVRLFYADGEHEFLLATIKSIHELETKCNAPVRTILQRLLTDAWYINDVYETIRISAIGAGMDAKDAHALVIRNVIEDMHAGWQKSVPVARTILTAHLVGIPDETVGKPFAEGTKTETPATDVSFSPQSMASAPP